ncbi:HlyD family secretion protein [Verrucomicrobiaceae bacterium N1E253]|uniref:HlyD family secretion protein n=1 Tax=Oceaniferula marina TaxID=2748318 RepID=A0A851GMU2_9BACT|nr:HlyD family secretion protein [Oceaniferula marina]NWK55434.1 HlyD family secretion protein [Oceaniferula marina]
MDLLLILTYTALCVAIFKIFKIPLNKWTVPTAVLGGIVLVGGLVFLMNYNHPHSRTAVRAFVSTPIVPNVKGIVVEIPVKPNVLVKKGDVLLRIDPVPFQAIVDQKRAILNLAKAQIKQMNEMVEQAQSAVDKAQSERDRTFQSYERFTQASAGGAVSETSLENRRQFYISAEAVLAERKANLARQKLELESQKTDVLVQLQAELDRAQFDLDSTVVKAPSDGYVTHLRVRPGMMAASLPLRPTMNFISTDKDDHFIIASFRQNATLRLKSDYDAEVLFPSIPGKVFKAKVVQTMPALGEGEMQAGGTMLRSMDMVATHRGLMPVKIRLEDDISEYHLPDGVFAEVAVYSDKMHHVAIMRKILLRMKSWQNYIYLDH